MLISATKRAVELAPSVYLLRRIRGCNVYYLADAENPTLIDAGFSISAGAIARIIKDLRPASPPPRWLLLTHYHVDHAGGADRLRRTLGIQVITHPAEAAAFAGTAPVPWRVRRYTARTRADRLVEDGEVLPILGGLRVVHTPGHTPGSLCFHLPDAGVLFTGDQFISYQDRLSRPFMGRESDQEAYKASLARIAGLNPDILLPGHGHPILRDTRALLQDIVKRGGTSHGFWAKLRNMPRLARFTLGLWRDADITAVPRQDWEDA